jgi:hypothetical protein
MPYILLYIFKIGSEAHPFSCPMAIGDSFLGERGKAA